MRIRATLIAAVLGTLLIACGGGGGSNLTSTPTTVTTPPPTGGGGTPVPPGPFFRLRPDTVPDANVGGMFNPPQGTWGFTTDIIVNFSPPIPYHWNVHSIPPGLQLTPNQNGDSANLHGFATQAGTYTLSFTVTDALGRGATDASFTLHVNAGPVLLTKEFPKAVKNQFYSTALAARGTPPFQFQINSPLPSGLTFSPSSGVISGTPTSADIFSIPVGVCDAITCSGGVTLPLLVVDAALQRNDSIATATPLSNGIHRASLSPYANKSGVAQPDNDYFKLVADGGVVTNFLVVRYVDANSPVNDIDPAIEIVDANGHRFTTCKNLGTTDGLLPGTVDPTPDAFDDPCVNDDIDPGVNVNSSLQFSVPGTGPQTFYLHVLDENGRARPDFRYELTVSGVK